MEPNINLSKKSMEYDCRISSECLAFQMKKLVFQSEYLVFL